MIAAMCSNSAPSAIRPAMILRTAGWAILAATNCSAVHAMELIPSAGLDDATWPVYTVGLVAQLLDARRLSSRLGRRVGSAATAARCRRPVSGR